MDFPVLSNADTEVVLSAPPAQRQTALAIVWSEGPVWLAKVIEDPSQVSKVPVRLLPLLYSCMEAAAVTACQLADKRTAAPASSNILRSLERPDGLSHPVLDTWCESPPLLASLASADAATWAALLDDLTPVAPQRTRAAWASLFSSLATMGSSSPAHTPAATVVSFVFGHEAKAAVSLPAALYVEAIVTAASRSQYATSEQVLSVSLLGHEQVRLLSDAFTLKVGESGLQDFVKSLPKSLKTQIDPTKTQDPLWGLLLSDALRAGQSHAAELFYQYADVAAATTLPFLSPKGTLPALSELLLDAPLYNAPDLQHVVGNPIVLRELCKAVVSAPSKSVSSHRAKLLLASATATTLDLLETRQAIAVLESVCATEPLLALDYLYQAPRDELVRGVSFLVRHVSSDERAARLATAVFAAEFDNDVHSWQLAWLLARTWEQSLDDLLAAVRSTS